VDNEHKRYRTFIFECYYEDCPKGGTSLKMILFKQEEKLRNHAIKHLGNPREFRDAWKNVVSVDWLEVSKYTGILEDMGCPFYKIDFSILPCWKCKSKNRWNKCSEVVSGLEEEYVKAVEAVIEEGGNIPRYACFYNQADNKPNLWILPNRKIIAKAVHEGNNYNLKTCYSPKRGGSFEETRDYERRKLCYEVNQGSITWCQYDTWGISFSSVHYPDRRRQKDLKKYEPIENKKQKIPYFRDRPGGWRSYLANNNI